MSRLLATDKIHKLRAGAAVGTKHPQHGAGHTRGILFLDPSHGHTQMERLNDDGHPARIQRFFETFRDLMREAFLHLKAPGKNIHDPGDLA